MSETQAASTPPSPPSNPVSDLADTVVQARVVSGANRLQVLVSGTWYEVDGVASTELFTTDPRFAARVTFTKVSTISAAAAGSSITAGTDMRPGSATGRSMRSSSPVTTTSSGIGQVTVHSVLPNDAPHTPAPTEAHAE